MGQARITEKANGIFLSLWSLIADKEIWKLRTRLIAPNQCDGKYWICNMKS